jgi:hypothetical protein
MKQMILGLLLLTATVNAEVYTKADRVKDMTTMAEAMNIIQSGFFYNNYDTVSAGVETLTNTIAHVKPVIEETQKKDVMERYMDKKFQMTNKIVKKINQKALTILQRFKSGDAPQAVQAYTKIMGQCMQCHREIRHW